MEVSPSTLPTSPPLSTPMVLSSSGGGSRINRARVTYGGRGRTGGLLHLKKPPTTSSLTSLPDESDDDSSDESSSSSSEDERKVGKMLVEKKEKVQATRTAAPWKKAGSAVKKEPLRQHAANTAHAAPTKPTPLKVSVPAPHPTSSSSLSSAPSSSAVSSASTSSRKASLAAQRKVQRILSFEEEEKRKADGQEKQIRGPSQPETTAHDAAEDVAQKLEQQLHLSEHDDASEPTSELASLLAACSQRQPLAFGDALQSILGGPTSSHLLLVEKAGDASYSKVYRLTRRVTNCEGDIDWEESSILKVIPLRSNDMTKAAGEDGSMSDTSSCADVEREIGITRTLCLTTGKLGSRPRFVELRGAYIAEGPLPAVLCDVDGHNDDSGHASDHQRKAAKKGRRAHASSPRSSSSSSSSSPTLYALLDLSDCGVDLESYTLPSSSPAAHGDAAATTALSIFAQVVDSLAIAEELYEFEHRDLHWGNVLVCDIKSSSTSPSPAPSLTWSSLIDSDHTGVDATIIDFTLSRLAESDRAAPRYYDLSVDESLFEGDGEVDEQFDVYRGMRDVIERAQGDGREGKKGGWERFEPRTNVLWARYLVRKLLDGKGLRREGPGREEEGGNGALDLLEAVEHVLNESVAHFLALSSSKRSTPPPPEVCIESMVQLRDWMMEEMERRVRQQQEEKEEQARRPRARQQSQRPRKAAAATKEDGPTRRRSVRR